MLLDYDNETISFNGEYYIPSVPIVPKPPSEPTSEGMSSWYYVLIVAVILLFIGIGVGFFIKKRNQHLEV